MAKAKLITRQETTTTVTSDNFNKGSELSFAEADSNFLNLRDTTFGVTADDSATIQIGMDNTLYIRGGTNCTTSTNSDGSITINSTGGGSADTGDITFIGSTIISPSNADITLDPGGTGSVQVGPINVSTDNVISTAASDSTTLTITTQGSGNISLTAETISLNSSVHIGLGGDSAGGLIIEDNTIKTARSNEDIELDPAGTGVVSINGHLGAMTSLSIAGDGASVTGIKDEDNMASDSAVKLATQQSIKKYVDDQTSVVLGGEHSYQAITTVPSATVALSPDHDDIRYIKTGGGTTSLSWSAGGLGSKERMDVLVWQDGTGTLTVNWPSGYKVSGTSTVSTNKARLFHLTAIQDAVGTETVWVECSQDEITWS